RWDRHRPTSSGPICSPARRNSTSEAVDAPGHGWYTRGMIRRALVSVSDKTGVVELARAIHELGGEILSTGGTAAALAAAGVAVTQVSAHTGAPEILDGRVKTLHPRIHGGLLGRATPAH